MEYSFKVGDKVKILESVIAGLTGKVGIFKGYHTNKDGTRAIVEYKGEEYSPPIFLIEKVED